MQTLNPANWIKLEDYSQGVIATGPTIFLAGQIGVKPETFELAAHDLAGQVRQALKNIVTLLETAGAKPSHLTRLNWYILNREEYYRALPEIRAAYLEIMGSEVPAMTLLVVSGLAMEGLLVEIEATAVLPD